MNNFVDIICGMVGVAFDEGEFKIFKDSRNGEKNKGVLEGLTATDLRQLKQAIERMLNKEIK